MCHRVSATRAAIAASVLLAQVVLAEAPQSPAVDFDPSVTAQLQNAYGPAEAGVLREAIIAAVAKEARREPMPAGLTLKVTVRQIAPSHPTRKQQTDDPTLDPVKTHYAGGADLVGEILDAKQQVLATVGYRNFAIELSLASPSWDAWADARVAIDRFAAKLATTWSRLPKLPKT